MNGLQMFAVICICRQLVMKFAHMGELFCYETYIIARDIGPHLQVATKIDCHTQICKSFIFLTLSILMWVFKSLHQLAFLVQVYTQHMYIFILCCFPLLGFDMASFHCYRHFTHFKWGFTCPWLLLHLQNTKPLYAYHVSCQIPM
jgi:hypothetical protein